MPAMKNEENFRWDFFLLVSLLIKNRPFSPIFPVPGNFRNLIRRPDYIGAVNNVGGCFGALKVC